MDHIKDFSNLTVVANVFNISYNQIINIFLVMRFVIKEKIGKLRVSVHIVNICFNIIVSMLILD